MHASRGPLSSSPPRRGPVGSSEAGRLCAASTRRITRDTSAAEAHFRRSSWPDSTRSAPPLPVFRHPLYRLTKYRRPEYSAAMIEPSELPDALRLPELPAVRGNRWTPPAICSALLAATAAAVLFLMLVVIPSAGAAGGCGGG